MFDEYPRISEVLPPEDRSRLHPLVKDAFDARYALGQLEEVESLLERLYGAGLFTPGLRRRLRTRTQFLDTMAEVHTAIRLLDCGLKPEWGNPWPDIILADQDTGVEVKRLHASQKVRDLLEEAKGEVVVVDDKDGMGRLKSMVEERVLPTLKAARGPFVLVVQAEDQGFDEFEDCLLNGLNRDGLFHDPECEKISAVVRMERSFVLQRGDGAIIFHEAEFKGIPNPNCVAQIPGKIRVALNIV